MLHRIKAVIFDFDGTLLDVYEIGVQFLIKLFNKYGLELSDKKARSIRDWRLREIMDFFNESLAKKLRKPPVSEEEIVNFLNQSQCQYKLFSDTMTVLRRLKQEGTLMLLVSNRTDQGLAEQLSKHEIDGNFFFYVKGVYGTPAEKPHPDCLLEAVELLRARNVIVPDEVICVGDHLLDMQAADAWNIRFFALTCGVTTRQKFIEASLPESHVYGSLSDLFLK